MLGWTWVIKWGHILNWSHLLCMRERERERDAHVCIEKKKTKMKSWRFVKNLVIQLTLPDVFNEDT